MTRRWGHGRAAAIVALAATFLLVPAVTAQEVPGEDAEPAPGRLRLASQTPWVQPDGELTLRLDVAPELMRAGTEVAVTVYQRLTSRSAFALTLEDVFVGSPLRVITSPIADLTRDASGAVWVTVPVRSGATAPAGGGDRVLLRREGVYPVRVEARVEGGEEVLAQLTTHLVRLPDSTDLRPLAVAWVQPVSATPAHAPDGSVAVRADGRRRLDRVLEGLAAARDVPLTLVPVPETLEALAGGSGPEAERDAERLAAVREAADGRQVVAGPYAPVAVSSLVGSGLADELVAHLTRGEDALVTHLGVRPDRRTWVADGPLDARAVAELRRAGVQRIVIPDDSLEPVDLPLTLTRPFELAAAVGRTAAGLAVDTGLTAHFPAEAGEDPVLRAHHLLADLAVLYFDLPGVQRGVAVAPPGRWQESARFLSTALHGVESAPILEPVTVDELFEGVPVAEADGEPLVRALADAEPLRLAVPPTAVESARARLAGYASLTSASSPTLARAEVPLLLSTSSSLSAADRRRYLDGANGVVAEAVSGIVAPDRQGITLTAREGAIPLTFQNLSGRPATVHVSLRSDKLEFGAGADRHVLRLDERNTTIEVPVRTRTSGAFPLHITVTSPDGGLVVSRTQVTVRSTVVSGVGLFLTVGAGVFLAGWWGRHLHGGRRARGLVGPD